MILLLMLFHVKFSCLKATVVSVLGALFIW